MPANADQFALTHPYATAIYLPAVNANYATILEARLDPTRPLPMSFRIEDLAFWSGNSALWNHKFLLHSIGTYAVGDDPRGPLFNKKRGDFVMVGDSSGYQIGKGTLKGLQGLRAGMTGSTRPYDRYRG